MFQAGPTVSVGHRLALEKATENAELSEQLGLPLTPGPWYNASIGLTHRDNMANCQFTVVGSKHSSDIYMRVGYPTLLLLLQTFSNAHVFAWHAGFVTAAVLPSQLGNLSPARTSHGAAFLAGCEDQGASKYLVVQSGWSSQLGGATHGSFNLSWRWPVTQYQPYRHSKATQGRGCWLIRHFASGPNLS